MRGQSFALPQWKSRKSQNMVIKGLTNEDTNHLLIQASSLGSCPRWKFVWRLPSLSFAGRTRTTGVIRHPEKLPLVEIAKESSTQGLRRRGVCLHQVPSLMSGAFSYVIRIFSFVTPCYQVPLTNFCLSLDSNFLEMVRYLWIHCCLFFLL